jgi:(p)ppGpp synthase/HD superfamily hydrolase
MMRKLINQALEISRLAHFGQTRKDNKDKMLDHVNRVAAPFGVLFLVAQLHDVVEDSDWTLEELREEFPSDVVDAIDAITRRDGEPYRQYIERCGKNPTARLVKLMDLRDNVESGGDFAGRESLNQRHRKAYEYLRIKGGELQ